MKLNPPTPTDQLLTTQEVATLLRVSEVTVRRLIRARVLGVVRIGRSVRISPSQVATYLAENSENPTPRPPKTAPLPNWVGAGGSRAMGVSSQESQVREENLDG